MASPDPKADQISRRGVLQRAAGLGMLMAIERLAPSYAWASVAAASPTRRRHGPVTELTIAETPFRVRDRTATAVTINGTVPGPLVRFREGDDVTLRVVNRLHETTGIHWHGLLVPPGMDGVPGVSFAGIKGGTTFAYRFTARQSGTYWYHSHSGLQELRGMYGPLIIDPVEADPVQHQREYVVMLSDWSLEKPASVLANLKKQGGYYNFQKRTAGDFFSEVGRKGLGRTLSDYLKWSQMRMDPTDFADVSGYAFAYLMNGLAPEGNWTALFNQGERVRLRFINAGTMTFYDVRIPGLPLTIVQADGQNVQPVEVDEFRMGPAETYDVIVQPRENIAYTIFAETMDRSGYARGTLAPRSGMSAPLPSRRSRPLRTMEDMGMSMQGMGGMDMGGKQMPGMPEDSAGHMNKPGTVRRDAGQPDTVAGKHDMADMPGMRPQPDPAGRDANRNLPSRTHRLRSEIPGATPVEHGPDTHGTGNQAVPEITRSRLDDPGAGLGQDGWRVLVYTDLKALKPYPDRRPPERELEIHATGHMERYMWSFDGKKYSEAGKPIHFRYGERLRWTFVNDTMMEHPLHLHGMFMELENGAGDYLPRKHTVIVKPAERVSVAITADARGHWAFHCHLLLHMERGMFRVVEVADQP
ncbi:MAG: copper resistance system multicopper oxidase [Gemmatimonadales bacterium]